MNVRDHVRTLNEERRTKNNAIRAHLEGWAKDNPGKPMDADARATEARLAADIAGLEAEITRFVDREQREQEGAEIRNTFGAGAFGGRSKWEQEDAENGMLRNFFDGKGPREITVPMQAIMKEREAKRNGWDWRPSNALYGDTGTGTLTVPTILASQIYEVMEAEVAGFRLATTKINTPDGAPLNYPKVSTHSIATQVAGQGSLIGGTDPVFDQKALNAYKYGQLVNISDEVITDSSIDIVSLIARDTARALGRVIDADLINGTGTGEPQGIMPAIAGSGTIHGSVAGVTYENLVDLMYSVNTSARQTGSAAFLMRDSTAGAIRKLRDGAGGTVGSPLWKSETSTGGMANYTPPTLLGDPAFTDPNVASIASTNKVVVYGDWSSYYLRTVGDLKFERDDSLGFDKDTVYFRCKWRVGGQVMDTAAFNVLRVV
jgi:HK97 family phage major capsid protein